MKADSYKTELADRVLWFDGTTSIRAKDVLRSNIPFQFVDQETPEVQQYNKFVSAADALRVKESCNQLTYTWNIPATYKTLNVNEYLYDRLIATTRKASAEEFEARACRLAQELTLFKKYNFYDVLRALIYIINTLTANNAVWGIGRGSSVSSYVLYLIGTHDVDSFTYDLDISDFLHE
jgi:DNA polymerase III alpha subunit